jgi:hypothetical protein
VVNLLCNPQDVCRSRKNISAILSPPSRELGCQFVYREILSVVWRTQNNRSAILKKSRIKKWLKCEPVSPPTYAP